MKKNLFILLMILLTSISAYAAGEEEEKAEAGGDVELFGFFNETYEVEEAVRITIQEYLNMNPNVKLEVSDVINPNEAAKKIVVLMASGVPVDIIRANNPIQLNRFIESGALLNLNDLANKYDMDPEAYFGTGKSMLMKDGNLYAVGNDKTSWLMYYNKDIFDRAGVPYPSPDVPMTWKEYRETAKKLTMGEGTDKVYGALHLNWVMFWYMSAIQKLGGGEYFYKEDGSSNIMDPAFRESIEFFYNMQAEDKTVPSYAEVAAQKINSGSFLSGRYGMSINGQWIFELLKNPEDFPRDWNAGIAPMPVFEGAAAPYSWGVVSGFGIGKNSENPEEAFKLLKYIVDNKHQYFKGGVVSPNNLVDMGNIAELIAKGLEEDEITPNLIETVLLNPEMRFVTEKITGNKSGEYQKICVEELEKYFIDAVDLDTALAAIKERADKIIIP